ncbi:MAG: SDR family NAD(P)-dependent oxidoreductase [Spirochaetes bacterium]|nr:SDR family NAD(P)-dependent oxidoreductase [Spirochaetota bacterium]
MNSILITGASSGIGRALAELYARKGARLGLMSRQKDKIEEIGNLLREGGTDVYAYTADVGDAGAMRRIAEDFIDKTNGVDVVIANAGIRIEEDEDYSDSSISEKIMRTNFSGVINTFAPFLKTFKSTGKGHLVVISSIASFRGTQNSGLYSASKAAVNLWTESLRLRLKPFGIPVTTVYVGFVDTDMTSDIKFHMPGLISADEAARSIDYAIRHRMRHYTFPWQSKIIWNMLRIIPGTLYDWLITVAKRHQIRRRI